MIIIVIVIINILSHIKKVGLQEEKHDSPSNKSVIQRRERQIDMTELPIDEESVLRPNDDAPEHFKYVFLNALRTDDYEELFKQYTQEEIDMYSNFYNRQKRRGR